MTRQQFIRSAASAALVTAAGDLLGDGNAPAPAPAPVLEPELAVRQAECDEVAAGDYEAYLGDPSLPPAKAALGRIDAAFEKVLAEVRAAEVPAGSLAAWHVYNMGVVAKTHEACFSIDLVHRHAAREAGLFDFALITHNHGDHFTEAFYQAMNSAGKTVISNFKDNYGTRDWKRDGGYTRAAKTFRLKDVEILTGITDHNDYLVDFTSTFEVHVGGYTLFHTGDCSNAGKLHPTRTPDLWIVHPMCCMHLPDGLRQVKPRRTVLGHLNELGHPKKPWRWSYRNGMNLRRMAAEAGYEAEIPLWGDRLV